MKTTAQSPSGQTQWSIRKETSHPGRRGGGLCGRLGRGPLSNSHLDIGCHDSDRPDISHPEAGLLKAGLPDIFLRHDSALHGGDDSLSPSSSGADHSTFGLSEVLLDHTEEYGALSSVTFIIQISCGRLKLSSIA